MRLVSRFVTLTKACHNTRKLIAQPSCPDKGRQLIVTGPVPSHFHTSVSFNVTGQFLVILMFLSHAMLLVTSWSFSCSNIMQWYLSVPGHSHAPVSCSGIGQFPVFLIPQSHALVLVSSWSFSCSCLMQCYWSVPGLSLAPISCSGIGQFLVILMLLFHAVLWVSS